MVVVWGGEDVLSSSIEFFLATKVDWQVISISKTKGLDALTQAVETTHPDIVIIFQECYNSSNNIPLQLLMDYPAIKVIMMNLEDNTLEVFNKQNIKVKHASDLITVIEQDQ
jgi:hypothetical protein